MRKNFVALGLLLSMLVTAGAACGSTTAAVPATKTQPITLQYWGVFTDSDQTDILIKAFVAKHPNITVEYRKFRPEEYEQKLIEAFAQDKGPDIFAMQNTWLKKYKIFLTPMPAQISYAVFTKSGGAVGSQTTVSLATATGMTLKGLKDKFVPVVEKNSTAMVATTSTQASIYALPFYVDTLAMYYNNDLLAQNGIVQPATTWQVLMAQVEKIRRLEKDLITLTQSGAAMGTGANVHRSADLLAAIMMQFGTQMMSPDGSRVILTNKSASDKDDAPAVQALHFYTDFANPQKSVFTWSNEQGDSLDAFAQGRVGYYFGYSYDLATIKGRNPRLNVAVTALPQNDPSHSINVANYWMEGVAKKSKHAEEAWLFIMETATNKDALAPYLAATGRASALKDILQKQLEDVNIGVFAAQALTAQSWYRGGDSAAAENVMMEMIDDTLDGLKNKPADKDDVEVYTGQVNRANLRINDTM